jgi:glycosyltransferase involved in cell wall biosynthesis
MRICIVSGSFPPLPCGIGDNTKMLAGELVRDGHRVTVITSCVTVASSPSDTTDYVVQRCVASWGLWYVPRVVRLVSRARPDVVVLQYPTSAYRRQLGVFMLPMALRWGLRRWRARCVLAVVHEFRRTPPLKRVALAFMVMTAHRTLLSPEDMGSLGHFVPARLLRITKRPPSAATFPERNLSKGDYDEARRACGWMNGEILILHFGFLSPRKGLGVLIEAVAELARTSARVRLVIVGEAPRTKTAWLSDLRTSPPASSLGRRIVWLGYQEDNQVVRLLKVADMCVLPFTDGYSPGSASFAQAAACGTPIITTQPILTTTETERLVDGTNVLLVPREDAGSLAVAIQRLIKDPELRDRLRVNGPALSAHPSDTVRALLEAVSLVYGGSSAN